MSWVGEILLFANGFSIEAESSERTENLNSNQEYFSPSTRQCDMKYYQQNFVLKRTTVEGKLLEEFKKYILWVCRNLAIREGFFSRNRRLRTRRIFTHN